jgi:chromosomal replication initiation ATPase DnaA
MYFDIPVNQLKSKSRKQEIAYARFIFMFISTNIYNYSHTSTSKAVNRDHSTVCHAIKQVNKWHEIQDVLSRKMVLSISAINKKMSDQYVEFDLLKIAEENTARLIIAV